jgi:hypothetical protein
LLEVETTVKSMITLKGWPATQVLSGLPLGLLAFDAPVMETSPAVQPRVWLLPAAVNKSCAQVPLADAGETRNSSATTAMNIVSEHNPVKRFKSPMRFMIPPAVL